MGKVFDGNFYILDEDHQPVPAKDITEWGEFMFPKGGGMGARIVHQTTVNKGKVNCQVSTVFLGMNHNWLNPLDPRFFETMIFDGPFNQMMWRYATWNEASMGHLNIVEHLEAGLPPATKPLPVFTLSPAQEDAAWDDDENNEDEDVQLPEEWCDCPSCQAAAKSQAAATVSENEVVAKVLDPSLSITDAVKAIEEFNVKAANVFKMTPSWADLLKKTPLPEFTPLKKEDKDE